MTALKVVVEIVLLQTCTVVELLKLAMQLFNVSNARIVALGSVVHV